MKEKYDAHPNIQPHTFEIGEFVKRRLVEPNKFEYSWTGPFIITGYDSTYGYRLMKPNGAHLPNYINPDDIAPWRGSDSNTFYERSTSEPDRETPSNSDQAPIPRAPQASNAPVRRVNPRDYARPPKVLSSRR
ncbi:hypothetical protein HK102_007672 [Quaeritorhiza haematococci]|nr:hypothetical protein HK102_007672 [Quaeritorhiza haematococci]